MGRGQTTPQLVDTIAELMVNAHRFRPALLLSHEDAPPPFVREHFPPLGDQGHALYAMLSADDLELLSDTPARLRPMRFTMVDFFDGLPVAVYVVQVGKVQFRWAVPMWQSGAREWLMGVIEQEEVTLFLDTGHIGGTLAIVGQCPIRHDKTRILAAASSREPTAENGTLATLMAALQLMREEVIAPFEGHPSPEAIRVMVPSTIKETRFLTETIHEALTAEVRDTPAAMEATFH